MLFTPSVNAQTATTLADLMGQGSAGAYMGQQMLEERAMNEINQNLSLADLDKITLANDHNRIMNPMLQQVQRAEVRNADSKTPEYFTGMRQGELGTARSNVAKAKLDEGTLDTNIAAKNLGNQTQMFKDMGSNMLNAVAYVGQLPPGEQREAMKQLITSQGWDKNPASREIWDRLLQSPDMLMHAQNVAERLMDFDPAHLSRMATGKQTADSNELIHSRSDASRERVAAGNNNATIEAARLRQKGMNDDQLKFKLEESLGKGNYAAGEMLAKKYAEEGDMQSAEYYRKLSAAIKQQQIDKARASSLVGDDRLRGLLNMPREDNTNTPGTPRTYDPATKTWR